MTIRETVENALKDNGLAGYEDRARPVITALEVRESDIVESLTDFAVAQGLNRDQTRVALAECGLDVGTAGAGTSEDPRIAQMEAQVEEMQATLRLLRGEG